MPGNGGGGSKQPRTRFGDRKMGDDTQNRCRRDPAEIPTEGWREFAKGQFANRNPARVSARERVAGERDWPRR